MSVASGYTGDYQHPCNRIQPHTSCIICSKDTEMAAKVKKQWWILWALHQQLQGSTNNNRESRWVSWSNVANHLLCKLLSAVFLARFFPPRFKICQRCRKKNEPLAFGKVEFLFSYYPSPRHLTGAPVLAPTPPGAYTVIIALLSSDWSCSHIFSRLLLNSMSNKRSLLGRKDQARWSVESPVTYTTRHPIT